MAKVSIESIYPLAPMQQGMLFHSIANPQSTVYVVSVHVELVGELNVAALQRAWQHVIERYPVLRTTFVWKNRDEPLQIVRHHVELPWQEHDWSHLPIAQQQEKLEAFLHADRERGFSLTKPPLMRLNLIRVAPNQHHFVWSLHHVLADGWSVALLLREAFEQYQAILRHERIHLEQPRPYKDYVTWLQQQDMAHAETYWRETLRDFAEPTPITVAATPNGAQNAEEIYERLHLSRATTTALQSLAQQHQITLNTLFQGAWSLLLSRYSGTTDVLFGAVVSGRSIPFSRIESMVGVFMNTLPVRVHVPGDKSLVVWLKELQTQQNQARRFEYSSLRDIQAWSDVSRAQRNSLFDSILVFGNYPQGNLIADQTIGLETRNLSFLEGSHYPISVLVDPGERILIRVHYDCHRFEARVITRLLLHFEALLEAMAHNPAQLLADFRVLTAAEWQQLVVDFNRTETLVSAETTIIQRFEQQVERTPDAIALRFGSQTLSYAQLNLRANQLAHFLINAGVGAEDIVALCLERSPEAIIAMLGTLKAGGGYMPLDATLPQKRLALILDETEVAIVLTTEQLAPILPQTTARVVCLDTDWAVIASESAENPATIAAPDNLAYIIYTSGSTGTPKGTVVRHSNLLNYAAWASDFYLQGERLDFPLFSSLSFDLTVTSIFVPLISGNAIVIYGEQDADALTVLDVVNDNLVDIIKLTPAHLALLKEIDPQQTRLRKMIVGGEDFKRSLALDVHQLFAGAIEIYNEYGPTEATVGCMIHRFDPDTDLDPSVPIGRPITNAQVYVLDEQMNPVPPGVIGEMCVGGAGVARGYLKRPELTAAKFVDNPFQPGATLYRTGDLARWSAAGKMQFLGRSDHQVKLKGYRVELGEIESNLLTHPAIVDAVVAVMQPEAAAADQFTQQCVQCGLPDNYPGATFDAAGVCNTCRDFNALKERFEPYFKTSADLQLILDRIRNNGSGNYDCLVLYSGGKDSSYMLYQLVKEYGMTPLVFSLDNGYISEEAKDNMRRVTADLGVDLVFGRTPHMNAVFVDSLQRHSNVCDGCFKVIYTLAISLARNKGINTIFTGLSRGQLFETRLSDMFKARIFDVDEIDRTVLEARKAYHRFDDAVTQLMDVAIFQDDAIFGNIQLVDFYRYTDVPLQEMYAYLDRNAPWVRPSDTGRSTNCLINDAGIYVHKRERGYHNYALPYSWDVRVGHKTRTEAIDELNDDLDEARVQQMLREIGYDETADRRTQLVAYYVAGEAVTPSELRRFLESSLPDYMMPTHFMPLDAMPLTRNGKIDRQALPQPEFGRIKVDTQFVAAETVVEQQLVEIWSAVLTIAPIGIHDNFFELGGDSISTIQVMMRIATAFQIELSPIELFEIPTVAQLAHRIEEILIAEIESLSDEEAERLLSTLT